MMKTITPVLFATSALMLGACAATLEVEKVKPGPQTGLVYALPMTQFKIDITRQAKSCKDATATEDGELEIKNDFSVEKVVVDDPTRVYAIKPETLSHFFNASSTAVTFHKGTRRLASINSSVQDEAGSALTSVVKGVGSMMTAGPFSVLHTNGEGGGDAEKGNGLQEVGEEGSDQSLPTYCDILDNKIAAAKVQEDVVKAKAQKVGEKILQVSVLLAEQASQSATRKGDVYETVFEEAKKLVTLREELASAQEDFDEALKKISHKQSLVWPQDGEVLASDQPIGVPNKVLKNWGKVGDDEEGSIPEWVIQTDFDLYLSLETKDATGRTGDDQENTAGGIRYRTPVDGALVFRRKSKAGEVEEQFSEKISQLGYTNTLLVESGAFGSVSFEAEFDADGGLKSAGYKETGAPAKAAVSVLGAAVEEYRNVAEYRRNKPKKALDDKLAVAKAELEMRETEEKLAAPTDDDQALEELNAETTMLEAQIALLEAEKKLLELQDM